MKENDITPFIYDVFISYSTDPDYKLARKVEEFLESFHKLRTSEDIKLKPLSVCRDGADFSLHSIRKRASGHPDGDGFVQDVLMEYLAKARYLLVLCSKNATLSNFVQFEIEWFVQNRGPDFILLAVTEGDRIRDEKKIIFSEIIIQNSLQTKIYYDLRGFRKESKQWEKVRDFEEELTNFAAFLNNETSGRILPLWQKAERKRLQKQRYISGIASLIFLLLAVAAFFQRREAVRQKENVQKQLLFNYWNSSQASRTGNDLLSSLHFTAEAVGLGDDKNLVKNLLLDIDPFLPSARLKTIVAGGKQLTHALFSPDGKIILTVGVDSIVRLWDVASGKPVGATFKAAGNVNDVSFSRDGKLILTACSDAFARLWDAGTGKAHDTVMKMHYEVDRAIFNHDGKKILTLDYAMNPDLWDVATGTKIGRLMEHVEDAVFSTDGKQILTISPDSTARIWNAGTTFESVRTSFNTAMSHGTNWSALTEQQIGSAMKHDAALKSAIFSPDGKLVLTICENGTFTVWNAVNQTRLFPTIIPDFDVVSAVFSPDGSQFLTTNADFTARLWNTQTAKLLGISLKHNGDVKTSIFSPDGKLILTSCRDRSVRLWDAVTGEQLGPALLQDGDVISAMFSSDGKQILTAGAGTVRVWDLASENPGRLFLNLQYAGYSAAYSPNGQQILTAGAGNTARIFTASTGNPVRAAIREEDVLTSAHYSSAVYSPDAKKILTASSDYTVKVWNVVTGKQSGATIRHKKNVSSAVFSPDGKTILTASWDSTACIWDANSGKQIGDTMRHEGLVFDAVYSPDGKMILTAGSDRTARTWDARTGKPGSIVIRHEGDVITAAFSPGGEKIVTASSDLTARVWDARTGKPIGPAMTHELEVFDAVFNPDGNLILTASKDKTARLWEAGTGRPIGAPFHHRDAVSSAVFSPDGKKVLTADWNQTARVWNIGADFDFSADLFKLQARVMTGCELNTTTNEIQLIQTDHWNKLKADYLTLAREHYKICKYPESNLWRRFFTAEAQQFHPKKEEPPVVALDLAGSLNNQGLIYAENYDFPKAEKAYGAALQIMERLSSKKPQEYDSGIAEIQNNLGLLYYSIGKFDQAQKLLTESLHIREKLMKGNQATYTKPAIQTANNLVDLYLSMIDSLKYGAFKDLLQFNFETAEKSLTDLSSKDILLKDKLFNYYGRCSWYSLFADRFNMSEQSAKKALEMFPHQVIIKTNLAHALLFEGRSREALKVYAELKPLKNEENKSYATICLEDLDELEKEKITNKNVNKIRQFLRQAH